MSGHGKNLPSAVVMRFAMAELKRGAPSERKLEKSAQRQKGAKSEKKSMIY